MSKIAEQKALEAYPIDIIPDDDTMGFTSSDRNEVIRLGYIQGYDQSMKDFLEKAENWLLHNTMRELVLDSESTELVEDFVDDFKNHMQNE